MATKEWKEKEDEMLLAVAEATLKSGEKPKLLLHACCAPCASSVLELLVKYFCVTVYFFNPNIFDQSEYFRRHEELARFLKEFPPALDNGVELLDCEDFYDYGTQESAFMRELDLKHHPRREKERERGERCGVCYRYRLQNTFEVAKKARFDYWATTLTLSPRKDATKINEIGIALEKAAKDAQEAFEDAPHKNNKGEGNFIITGGKIPQYLVSDFKKADGYLRSVQLSKKYELYRQEYCGCVFSR